MVDEALRVTPAVSDIANSLLSNTSDAIIGVDCTGQIQSWNRAAEVIFGYSPSEMTGQNFKALFASDSEGDESLIAEEKLLDGAPVSGWEVRQLHKNGSIVHTCVDMWALSDPNGAVIGTCISARLIAKYRMLQSQLRQTGKLETVGRLAGGIAHDFNNLLTVISGYNGMIMTALPPESEMREWSIQVDKAAERAVLLTNQLLTFSRREVTRPKVLNINDLVEDLHKMLRRIVGEDIRITLSLEPGIENVRADPGQISQVFTNLVANARDAMPRGGQLTIATRGAHFDTPVAHHEFELAPGPYVEITVTDTGTGMDQETREHLFEPFFTTKSKGKGTGLGLSIVSGIVAQLRGEISVVSKPGTGTTFTIYLPATREPVERFMAAASVAASPDIAILIVEDDGDLRHLIRHMLLAESYTVYETADAQEAIRICQTVHIDLLLADVVMPDLNGFELAATLLRSNPSLRTMYMSGYVGDAVVPQESSGAGHNFLQKPFTAARLNEQIISLLHAPGKASRANAQS
jgi:PAS domain S-box-containing protein